MAEVARRRAAHFATYQADEEENEDGNIHTGGDDARTLGPWSSAVELVNARERAAAEREERLQCSQRDAQDGVQWQPSRNPALGPRPAARVRRLFDVCMDLLVQHADAITSLWGLPDGIKVALAAAVCAQRKMSSEVAQLFADGAPEELCVPNCTQLDEPAMCSFVRQACSARLERLELGCCGRGFSDAAARAAAGAGPLAALQSVRLHGAYRLADAGVASLLQAAPKLRCLSLPECPRLTGAVVAALPGAAPALRVLDLGGARGVDGAAIAAAVPQLLHLEELALDGIIEVTDEVVAAVARAPALRRLSLGTCQALTDAGVAALAAARPELEALTLDECGKVGDGAMTALAAGCRGLRELSLRRCSKAHDAALARVAEQGALRRLCVSGVVHVGDGTMAALARCCRELRYLDVSFCREVSESALGHVVDSCQRLCELHVFGCSQVTRRFLHGHSNDALTCIVGVCTLGPEPAAAVT